MRIIGKRLVLTVFVCSMIFVSTGEISFGAEKKKAESTKITVKRTKGKSGERSKRAKERQKAALAEYVEWLKERFRNQCLSL